MSYSISTDPTLIALQDDVAALKRDIGSLLSHLKSSATANTRDAAGRIEEGAANLYRDASAEACKSAKALGHQIEEQPVLALLVVLGLGYIGGRLLTR
jgi:glutamine synthetase adenylyltransferase